MRQAYLSIIDRKILPLATCGGTWLAIGPRDDLLVECGDSFRVIDTNGHEEARVTKFGASDEIWFNPGDGRVYFALNTNATLRPGFISGLGVYDAVHNKSLGMTEIAGGQGEHSVAVAAHGGKIFIPISDNPDNGAGGIAMMHAARIHHYPEGLTSSALSSTEALAAREQDRDDL